MHINIYDHTWYQIICMACLAPTGNFIKITNNITYDSVYIQKKEQVLLQKYKGVPIL